MNIYQVGTCGGSGIPLGLIVNDKCVTCKNSNGRCVHRSMYEKSKGLECAAGDLVASGMCLKYLFKGHDPNVLSYLHYDFCNYLCSHRAHEIRMHGILTEHGTFSFSDDDDDDIEGGEGGEGGEEDSWEDSGFATYGKQSKELFDKTFRRLVNDDKTSLRLRSTIAFLVCLFFLCAPVLVPHHSMSHVSISWIHLSFSSHSPCTSSSSPFPSPRLPLLSFLVPTDLEHT